MTADMNTGWKETKLGAEGVSLKHGFTFPSEDFSPSGDLPVVRIGNVQDGRIVLSDGVRYAGGLTSSDLAEQTIHYGDLLIAMTGGDETNLATATGRVGLYREKSPALLNQRVAKIVSSEAIDGGYLYYYLTQRRITRHFAATANGSVQRNLTNGHILNLELNLPPVSEQKSIASVLSSLDDKIELLRAENETLEAIAQEIFNEWFVKPAAGGVLPEGWELKRLSDVANVSIGRTPPRKEKEWFSLNPEDNKWISIKDLGEAGVYIDSSSEYITSAAVERFRIPVIPKGTVVVSFKLTLGRVAITAEDMYSNEAIAHIKTRTLPPEYTYLFLKKFDYSTLGSTSSIATATNSEGIKGIEILVPDNRVLGAFTEIVAPLFQKIRDNTQETQQLAKVRDFLLPRLMSGAVRVGF